MDNGLFGPNCPRRNHGWRFGLHSCPQTCARIFPTIFWLIVMSWCAVLSDCGRFSWLRSEPYFFSPIGLGGNWYILIRPHTTSLSKPWYNGVKCHHQLHYPPKQGSFHIHHMLIYYIPPSMQAVQASIHASSSVASRQWILMTAL